MIQNTAPMAVSSILFIGDDVRDKKLLILKELNDLEIVTFF